MALLVAGLSFSSLSASKAAELFSTQRAFYVPEVFITDMTPGYCVSRVSIRGSSDKSRMNFFVRFADDLAQTPEAEGRYRIAGLEFVSFNYFYLVENQHCDAVESFGSAKSILSQVLSNCSNGCADVAGELEIVQFSGLVATLESVNALSSVEIFERFSKKEKVEECVLRLPVRLPGGVWTDEVLHVRGAIQRVIEKYGLPIMDVNMTGLDLYLLLARDCWEKESYTNVCRSWLSDHNPWFWRTSVRLNSSRTSASMCTKKRGGDNPLPRSAFGR
jgi:hypothetical protein